MSGQRGSRSSLVEAAQHWFLRLATETGAEEHPRLLHLTEGQSRDGFGLWLWQGAWLCSHQILSRAFLRSPTMKPRLGRERWEEWRVGKGREA